MAIIHWLSYSYTRHKILKFNLSSSKIFEIDWVISTCSITLFDIVLWAIPDTTITWALLLAGSLKKADFFIRVSFAFINMATFLWVFFKAEVVLNCWGLVYLTAIQQLLLSNRQDLDLVSAFASCIKICQQVYLVLQII